LFAGGFLLVGLLLGWNTGRVESRAKATEKVMAFTPPHRTAVHSGSIYLHISFSTTFFQSGQ